MSVVPESVWFTQTDKRFIGAQGSLPYKPHLENAVIAKIGDRDAGLLRPCLARDGLWRRSFLFQLTGPDHISSVRRIRRYGTWGQRKKKSKTGDNKRKILGPEQLAAGLVQFRTDIVTGIQHGKAETQHYLAACCPGEWETHQRRCGSRSGRHGSVPRLQGWWIAAQTQTQNPGRPLPLAPSAGFTTVY